MVMKQEKIHDTLILRNTKFKKRLKDCLTEVTTQYNLAALQTMLGSGFVLDQLVMPGSSEYCLETLS